MWALKGDWVMEDKMFPVMQSTEQLKKDIWNAAIEKAAKEAEYYMDETVPEQIRKLKK